MFYVVLNNFRIACNIVSAEVHVLYDRGNESMLPVFTVSFISTEIVQFRMNGSMDSG